MKHVLILFLSLISMVTYGQQQYKITYLRSSNGTLLKHQDPIWVFSDEKESLISSANIQNNKATFPYEQTLVSANTYFQIANLNASRIIATKDSTSIGQQTFESTNESKKILGYNCKKVKTIINSNTIEIWYTTDLKIKGSPSVLGQNLGLVLATTRNGNFTVMATQIEKVKKIPSIKVEANKFTDLLTYKDFLWKSRFTTISVFKDQILNFSDTAKSNDSVMRFANGTICVRKIKIPNIPKGSQLFVDVTEQSNGDAYDRTGSVFLIPTDTKMTFLDGLQNGSKTLPIYDNGNGKQYQGIVATENFTPLLELMRFFTPFGIKQYNTIQIKNKTWEEQVYYRQDISELTAALNNKEVLIGVFIGNYDKGGHKINMSLTIHPEEENTTSKPSVIMPLFNTTNIMEMAGQEYGTLFNTEKGLSLTFNLKKDLKKVKLRYITTGHGGWENGDEFVPKKNTIYLNEKDIFHFTPWREDCGSYRLYNPASGNFSNGLSSSDYSRSNWCPGTTTNPIYIDLGDLKAGNHTLQVRIPQGAPEGSSFSAWNVSGVLIGD